MVQIFRTQPLMCADRAAKALEGRSVGGVDVPSRMYSLSSLRLGREEANPEYSGRIIYLKSRAVYYGEFLRRRTFLRKLLIADEAMPNRRRRARSENQEY